MAIHHYYLGCPEWANKDWKGTLYKPKTKASDFLGQYASVFNTVEGNTTFYALPKETTVSRWIEETPEHFRFCFKFPKKISHQHRLRNVDEELSYFFKTMDPLTNRLGPFFLQLPPSFGAKDLPVLKQFFEKLSNAFHYVVEVRHPDFFDEGSNEAKFHELLQHFEADRVVFDTSQLQSADIPEDDVETLKARSRKPNVPVRYTALSQHPFVRFVGHPDNSKNIETLADWAKRVSEWIANGKKPYIFIHTPNDVYAPHLARDFHQLLFENSSAIGMLPKWPSEEAELKDNIQMTMF